MADQVLYSFGHKDVVRALVKEQGLHEGIWQLVIGMGFVVANFGENDQTISPGAMMQVSNLALMKVDRLNNISVDAAEVNPKR